MAERQRQGSSEQQQDHHNYRGHPALAAGRRASTEDIVVTDRPRQHRQLSVTSGRSHRPASLSPFRPPKNEDPVDNSSSSSSSSSGLFNWRKKYNARRSSSSCVTPLAPAVQQQQANVRSTASGTSSRRMSQPAAFSLPQLVRRSLQPLISSSPSTDVDDVQADSVSKLRYMKCKQV